MQDELHQISAGRYWKHDTEAWTRHQKQTQKQALEKDIVLLHDNPRLHVVKKTLNLLENFQWEVLKKLP